MGVRHIFSHLIHMLFHSRCFVHPKPLAAGQVNRARPVAPGSLRSTRFMGEMPPEPGANVAASPMRQPSDTVQPTIPKGPDSAEPASLNGPGKLCNQCKMVKVKPPITKCKPCNSLYNRVNNAIKEMRSKSIAAWDDMNKHKKAEFIGLAKDLFGSDLRGRLQQFLEEDIESRESISLSGTGKFFDSPDLRDKYKNKPQQLQAILANTKTVVCPLSGVILYENMQHESNFKACKTRIEKQRCYYLGGGSHRESTTTT